MLGEQVLKLRVEKGLTQQTVAAKLGISKQSVCNWEKNVSIPPVEKVRELAALFGCTTDRLLAFDSEFRSLREINDISDEQNAHIQMVAEDFRRANKQ